MNESKQLYFAWIGFQRRQVSMAPHFGFENVFMPVERKTGKLRKILTYIKHTRSMLARLRLEKPEVVWVQLPQVPLLWVALYYRKFCRRDAKIIADCHNAMFRPPWSKFPFGLSLLSSCDAVLVHNEDVRSSAMGQGVCAQRLMVIEDPPASFGSVKELGSEMRMQRPWLVFPASFAPDEPIQELLDAARRLPSVTFLITGNVKNCLNPGLIENAPQNVRFMGFLSLDDFDSLILHSDGVIALTRFDGIQLSVCGEAVGAGKPMLVSGTSTLKRLFPEGSIFVNSESAASIEEGVKVLLDRAQELEERMRLFRGKITSEWIERRAQPLMSAIT